MRGFVLDYVCMRTRDFLLFFVIKVILIDEDDDYDYSNGNDNDSAGNKKEIKKILK